MPKSHGSSNRIGGGLPGGCGAHPWIKSRVHHLVERGLVNSSIIGLDEVRDYAYTPAGATGDAVGHLANVVIKHRPNKKAWIDHPRANREPGSEWARLQGR